MQREKCEGEREEEKESCISVQVSTQAVVSAREGYFFEKSLERRISIVKACWSATGSCRAFPQRGRGRNSVGARIDGAWVC